MPYHVHIHIHILNTLMHTSMHIHADTHTHTFLQPNDLIGVNCIMTVVNWSWVRGGVGLSGYGDGERMLRRCARKVQQTSFLSRFQ